MIKRHCIPISATINAFNKDDDFLPPLSVRMLHAILGYIYETFNIDLFGKL